MKRSALCFLTFLSLLASTTKLAQADEPGTGQPRRSGSMSGLALMVVESLLQNSRSTSEPPTPAAMESAEQPAADEPMIIEDATSEPTSPQATSLIEYDASIELDEPFEFAPESTPPDVAQPEPTESTPAGPLSTLPPTPDPFYGGVHQLLGVAGEQPLFPRHTIRPPRFAGKQLLSATGDEVPLDELPMVGNGENMFFTSPRATAASPGKVVLLVDGRALALKVLRWQEGTVDIELPAVKLRQPTPARLYMSNAAGVVIDAADFVMQPAK